MLRLHMTKEANDYGLFITKSSLPSENSPPNQIHACYSIVVIYNLPFTKMLRICIRPAHVGTTDCLIHTLCILIFLRKKEMERKPNRSHGK